MIFKNLTKAAIFIGLAAYIYVIGAIIYDRIFPEVLSFKTETAP